MRCHRTRAAAGLALAAALAGCAARQLPDTPVIGPQEQARWLAPLDSGLRVLLLPDHSAPLVTAVEVVGTGSTADPPGREGLAHLVEHLAFRSRPGGAAPLWDQLEQLGATFNAYTTSDLTVFHSTVHRQQLPRLMQLCAWRLARTLEGVSPADFAAEKGVVRSERRQRTETTLGNRPFELLLSALFPPGHPLARPPGGTDRSLQAISWPEVAALVKAQYAPDNLTLVIAGDVDAAELGRELGRWPAELLFAPGGPEARARAPRPPLAARAAPALPPPVQTALQRHSGPIAQPELLLAWSLPGGLRGAGALYRLTAAHLEQVMQAELDPPRDRDIERLSTHSLELADASLLIVRAGLRPGCDPEWARGRLLDIVGQAWSDPDARAEVASERFGAATDLLLTAGEPLGRALATAEHLAATGRGTFYRDQFRELGAIAPHQMNELGARFVTRARAVALFFEPESAEVPGLATGSGAAPAPAPAEEEHPLGGGRGQPGAAQMSARRILETVPSPGLARLPHFRLGNGLPVFVIPRPAAPVAQIELALRGGDATGGRVGLAGLAGALFPAGCHPHGSLLAVGGRLLGLRGLTASETFVRVFSGNLANGLAVLGDELTCRALDGEALLRLPDQLQAESRRFQRSARRPERLAGAWLWGALYPGHPFGQAGFVDPAALAGVRPEEARAFLDGQLRPDNGVLVVHGQVDPEALRAQAERYLGSWTAPARPGPAMVPPPLPPAPDRRRIFLIDRPGATQATLSLGCRVAAAPPSWRPAHDLLEAVAGKLAAKVRERWGRSYGLRAQVELMPGGAAHLQLGGSVDSAAAAAAVAHLLGVVRAIATGDVDANLFAAMRWQVGRSFAARFATAAVQASAIRTAFLGGWDLSVWDDYPRNLAETTMERLQALMAACDGREVVVVVGNAAALRPQLAAAGFPTEQTAGFPHEQPTRQSLVGRGP